MTIQIQRILLPTDFSTNSGTATKYACELAAKFDAELHLLHTLEVHAAAMPEFVMGLALPSHIAESRTVAEKSLALGRFMEPRIQAAFPHGGRKATAPIHSPRRPVAPTQSS